MSEKLNKAREYERERLATFTEGERPAYHLTPAIGWMNDPNGFGFYGGRFHLFYQYNPYDLQSGPMHWGHAATDDLLRWEHLPCALAPDADADSAGCWSGSAVGLPDGRQLLIYTGVRRDENGGLLQAQCVAFGDGIDYEKAASNPVIGADLLPEGCSKFDFRDPKVWLEEDGSLTCVTVNRVEDGGGAAQLFRSEDGVHWRYDRELDRSRNEYGDMWECPDFFELDGKAVLIVSPMNMCATKTNDFHDGNGCIAIIGRLDENGKMVRDSVLPIDHGISFYAPQTMLAPDGRRIMVAWMHSWEGCGMPFRPTDNPRWNGQMTIPRELRIEGGKLLQAPVRELDALHTDRVSHKLTLSGETELDGVRGRVLDMTVKIKPSEDCKAFSIALASDEQFETAIRFDPASSTLELDRTLSGMCRDYTHIRRCRVDTPAGELKLRILLDRYSVELFVGDGERTLSAALFTPQSADAIRFACDGETELEVEKFGLK